MNAVHDHAPLASIDLNLLVILDALLRERHVTRAAAHVGISQSAASHALARLRGLLEDPLLVRDARGLALTERAAGLAAPLTQALSALQSALAPPTPFDPATTRRSFTIATSDYGQFVLLPPLLARLGQEAPGIDLILKPLSGPDVTHGVAHGEHDVAIGPWPSPRRLRAGDAPAAGVHERYLFRERFVCIARHDHPAIARQPGQRLDVATYAALPHALVAPGGTLGGIVDTALAERGLTRRVALLTQQFLVAPWAIASSDLIVTLAERLARAFATTLPLAVYEPPLPLPGFSMRLLWHERTQRDPAHKWLRAAIVAVTREI